jgi:hypothetical protein
MLYPLSYRGGGLASSTTARRIESVAGSAGLASGSASRMAARSQEQYEDNGPSGAAEILPGLNRTT